MKPLIQAGKQGGTMARHTFIQLTKLHNVTGRIDYITSSKKQENLYAVYGNDDKTFWKELAACNQNDFKKSGTEGKCIEARELIIALPEQYNSYGKEAILNSFTRGFEEKYGVRCISAIHHNKRKTNLHIHLIFSERKELSEPIIKIASRNMFYDETGKHVRTKKEILDEDGNIREGCKIIKKGEVYEKNIFAAKEPKFKQKSFLNEVKLFYTELINKHVTNEKERLSVYDSSGPYLPMQKVGKNNPKAAEIEADNRVRREWNAQVDTAIVSGVSMEKIKQVKKTEITDKISESLNVGGYRPDSFADVVRNAVSVLARLVNKVIEAAKLAKDSKEKVVNKALSKPQDKVLDKAVNKAVKKETSSNEEDVVKRSYIEKNRHIVKKDDPANTIEKKVVDKEKTVKNPVLKKVSAKSKKQELQSSGLSGQDLIREYNKLSNINKDLTFRENAVGQIKGIIKDEKKSLSEYTGLKALLNASKKEQLELDIKDHESQLHGMERGLKSKYHEYGYFSRADFDKKWHPVERDYQNMMAEGKRAGEDIHSVRSDINRNKEIIRENNKIRDDKRAQGKKQDISL